MSKVIFSIQLVNDIRILIQEGKQEEIMADSYVIKTGCLHLPNAETPMQDIIIPLANVKAIVPRIWYKKII